MTPGRRKFIVTAGGVVAATAAGAIIDAPNVIAQPKVQWRMSTAFTAALDIHQGAALRLAKVVEETSGGRFRIEVFPGGQILVHQRVATAIEALADLEEFGPLALKGLLRPVTAFNVTGLKGTIQG